MELKSVTVQLNVKGREETHHLHWDDKAKAYISESGTVKVPDPKAKKVQVQVRQDVTKDKWDTFKGQCKADAGNEEICQISNKSRHQQIKQITVRFAPTAKAAETGRGLFADYQYAGTKLQDLVTDWVEKKVASGDLPTPPAKHIDALKKQMKGFTVALTQNELREVLAVYAIRQRKTLGDMKPLFKPAPRPPTEHIVPIPPKPQKPIKVSAEIAKAKTAQDQLDRAIRRLDKSGPKALIADLRAMFLEIDRAGEKVWAVMQKLQSNTDPAAAASVKNLKAARQKYNDAEKKLFTLLQQKVETAIAGLGSAHTKIVAIAKKGPSAAAELRNAKRDFQQKAALASKIITNVGKTMVLPGEKSSPRADAILARLKDVVRLSAEVNKVALAAAVPPPPAPTARTAAPVPVVAPPTPPTPEISAAQRALSRFERELRFLPDPPAGGTSPYEKAKMDKLYNTGSLHQLHALAAKLAKHTADFETIQTTKKGQPGFAELKRALETVTKKLSGAQQYVINEKIDPNLPELNRYRAQPPATSDADYDWLEDPKTQSQADKLAQRMIRDLSSLMGRSTAKAASGLDWKPSHLFNVAGNGRKLQNLKEAWEQAHAIKDAAYNYRMYRRLPASTAPSGDPASAAGAKTPAEVAAYFQKADAALKLVDAAYYKLFTHNSRSPITNDRPVSAIYTDEVRSIPRDLAAAQRAIDSLPDASGFKVSSDDQKKVDDIQSKRTEAYTKLTKAKHRFEAVKDNPVERPALSVEEKKQIKAARAQYATIRNDLKRAIADVNRIYLNLFDASGKPHGSAPILAVQSKYIAQLESLKSRLNAELSDGIHEKLTEPERAEWDALMPQRGEAQNKVAEALNYLAELKKQRDATPVRPAVPPTPVKATDAAAAPKKAEGLASMDAAALLEEVQRLRGLAVGASSLADATTHRDGIIAIVEEAHRRSLSSLESSAQRALKVANAKVVELYGVEKQPRLDAAPTPSAVEPPAPATPSAAEQRRQAAEAKKAAAAEEKEKRDAATQEITRLKGRRTDLEKELASADSPQKLDDYEKEIKATIGTLTGHETLIGPYATGVKNTYIALLNRIPGLRGRLQTAERQAKSDAEVSQLWSKAEESMSQGGAILAKPTVDHADTPQLQKIKGDLDGIESRLNALFTELPKEQDARRTRIATQLGKIREVSAKLNDRIHQVTSLANEDKPGSVARLRQEANALITQSKKLRKEGKKSAAALQPILDRLNAIDKALEEIGKKLVGKDDDLGRTILDHRIVIAEEVAKIEEITKPKKATVVGGTKVSKPEPTPQAAPLPGETTPAVAAAPAGPPKVAEAPPPAVGKVAGAEIKLGEIRGRITNLRLKTDNFMTEVNSKPEKISEDTFRELLIDLKALDADTKGLEQLRSDSDTSSDALSLKSSLPSLRNQIITNAAFIAQLVAGGTALNGLSIDQRLAKLQFFKSEINKIKTSPDIDEPTKESINRALGVIQPKIDKIESSKNGEPVADIVARLKSIDLFKDARITPDGRGIVLENMGKDKFKTSVNITDLFRALKPLDRDTPERKVVAATVQVRPDEHRQESVSIFTLLMSKGVTDVSVLPDSKMEQAKVTVTLSFDKASADAQRRLVQEGSSKLEAERKKEREGLEAQRLEPLRAVHALAQKRGGKAVEDTAPFTLEGKPTTYNRFYGSRVSVTAAADVQNHVDAVRAQMKLSPNEMVIIAVGSPEIAKELQEGLTASTHDKAVMLVKGLPPNAMVLITRSAYSNDSYKGKEYPFDELKPSGQMFNVALGDWAKAFPPYGVFHSVMRKLGVQPKNIERLWPQARRAKEVKSAPLARPVDERMVAPASATGPIKLPPVHTYKQILDHFTKKLFGVGPEQAAVYSGDIEPGSLERSSALKQRISNIMSHAKQLGMDHVLILYRGVLKDTMNENFRKFEAIVKQVDPEMKYLRVRQINQSGPGDNEFDKVRYVLVRDTSLKDDAIARNHEAYLKKQMDLSH